MRDEPRTHDLANQLCEVRRDDCHLIDQIPVQGLPVVGQRDDLFGEGAYVDHVGLGDVLAHRHLCGVDDCLCDFGVIVDEGGDFVETVTGECFLIADEEDQARILVVVGDDPD